MQENIPINKIKSQKAQKLNVYKKIGKFKPKGDYEKKLTKKDLKRKFQLKREKSVKVKAEEASSNLKEKSTFKPKFKNNKLKKTWNKKSNEEHSEANRVNLKRKLKTKDEATGKIKPKLGNEESNEEHSEANRMNLKRKLKTEDEATGNKKIKLVNLKKKERKLFRQKKKKNTEVFERNKQLINIWEVLRRQDCPEKKKIELLDKTFKLMKGHVKELCYAHDTVRVLECAFGLASPVQKEMLFGEIEDSIILLAKSKYAKFLLIKILRTGSKEQKNKILSKMHSHVISLITHSEAAEVVEVFYNECASRADRVQLVQEFYGPSFKYFKDPNVLLKQLLEKEPNNKDSIIQYMKTSLIKCFQKQVIKHSLIHYVLRELLIHADPQSRTEVIEAVREVLVEMLHTKDGARAAMHCIWHGTKKDRKVIVKSFKTHVMKIAQEEHGHLVLLSVFDSIDDTNLVKKHIISELLQDIPTVIQNLYGRKVLMYLISPRDSVYFCPDVIKILQEGDDNKTSIKDAHLRKAELKEAAILPLVNFIAGHVSDMYKDNNFCLAMYTILKNAKSQCGEAFNSIAQVMATPYSNEVKNVHIIECGGSNFILKKLISDEKDFKADDDCTESFSKTLIEHASVDVIKSWTECNRGCFLLVGLIETGIKEVVDVIKSALYGFHKQLSKKNYKGAEILLKKIK